MPLSAFAFEAFRSLIYIFGNAFIFYSILLFLQSFWAKWVSAVRLSGLVSANEAKSEERASGPE